MGKTRMVIFDSRRNECGQNENGVIFDSRQNESGQNGKEVIFDSRQNGKRRNRSRQNERVDEIETPFIYLTYVFHI